MADDQPPAWAHNLLNRIESLEAAITNQQASSTPSTSTSPPPVSSPTIDPNITIRQPGSDFHPPAHHLKAFPDMEGNFFRSPLEDTERKRFLFDCPKNSLRNYDPPELNRIHNYPQQATITDKQLHDIQYRLSGITRPIDWFTYQLVEEKEADIETLRQQSLDFAISIHSLLSDLASHVTELRSANFFRAANIHAKPPSAKPTEQLFESKALMEYVNLEKNFQQSFRQRPRSNARQQQRPRQNGGNTNTTPPSNHQPNVTPQQQRNTSNTNESTPSNSQKDFSKSAFTTSPTKKKNQ
jgi:hypothetical protein